MANPSFRSVRFYPLKPAMVFRRREYNPVRPSKANRFHNPDRGILLENGSFLKEGGYASTNGPGSPALLRPSSQRKANAPHAARITLRKKPMTQAKGMLGRTGRS